MNIILFFTHYPKIKAKNNHFNVKLITVETFLSLKDNYGYGKISCSEQY